MRILIFQARSDSDIETWWFPRTPSKTITQGVGMEGQMTSDEPLVRGGVEGGLSYQKQRTRDKPLDQGQRNLHGVFGMMVCLK